MLVAIIAMFLITACNNQPAENTTETVAEPADTEAGYR